MKNIQLFKKKFNKVTFNWQLLLKRPIFNNMKYYIFSLPKRYNYRMYRFLRNFKRLIFFKKQNYIKFIAFNLNYVTKYQSHINFLNKRNYYYNNFFFDWSRVFKINLFFRNFQIISFLNSITYNDDTEREIFELLQKNVMHIYCLNKSFFLYKITHKNKKFKNKNFNIKNLIKLKFFLTFLLFN